MSRPLKITLLLLGVLLALLIGAAIALPYLLDIESHRPRIEAMLGEALDEDVKIDSLGLKVFPRIAVAAYGTKITSRENGRPLLAVEALEGSLRIWPLLRREVEIGAVRVMRPDMLVEFDKGNRPRLLDKLEKFRGGEKPGGVKPAVEKVTVESLVLRGGSFHLRTEGDFHGLGKALELEIPKLTLSGLDGAGPMKVELEASLKSHGLDVTASGTLGPLPKEGETIPYDLKIRAAASDIAAFAALLKKHGVPAEGGKLTLEGAVEGAGSSEFSWDGSAALDGLRPQNTNVRIKGKVRYKNGALEVDGAAVSVEPFELSSMQPLWKKLEMPELAGRAGVEAELSGGPSAWACRGRLQGDFQKPRAISLDLKFDAAQSEKGERLDIRAFQLKTKAAELSASGSIRRLSGNPILDLQAGIKDSSLEELAALAELAPVEGLDVKSVRGRASGSVAVKGSSEKPELSGKLGLRDFSMKTEIFTVPLEMPSADITFAGETVTCRPVTIVLAPHRFEGSFGVKGFAAPAMDFDFSSPKLDIGALFTLLAEETPERAARRKATKKPEDDFLRKITLRGSLKTPLAVYDKVECRDTSVKVRMQNGIFTVEPLTFTLYGGATEHTFEADLTKDEPPFRLASTLKGVDTNALLTAGTDMKDLLYGKLHMKYALTGEGFETGKMGRRLHGDAHFEIKDGYLNSVNYLKKIQAAAGFIGIKKGIDENSTRFRRFDGDIKIGGQRFATENAVMESEDFETRFKGGMNFDLLLDLYATTFLSKELTEQVQEGGLKTFFLSEDGRATIPAHVKGPATDPKVTLDGDFVRKKLEEELKKSLKKEAEKAGKDLLESLRKKLGK